MDPAFRGLGFNPMPCGHATARLLRLSVGRDEDFAMPLLATQVVRQMPHGAAGFPHFFVAGNLLAELARFFIVGENAGCVRIPGAGGIDRFNEIKRGLDCAHRQTEAQPRYRRQEQRQSGSHYGRTPREMRCLTRHRSLRASPRWCYLSVVA
jgi:hypothetical protein